MATHRSDWPVVEERMRPFVRKRVRSDADADDVLQDLFLRVEQGLSSLRDADRFDAWLYRIARNLIHDRFRREQGLQQAAAELAERPPADPRANAAAGELAKCIEPFVERLPSPYREAVRMVELEGLTHKEAAERAGITEPGMKSRVQRGRAKLRGLFETCCRIERDRRGSVTDYHRRSNDCGGC